MSRTQISATALFALPLTLALACGNVGCATGTNAPHNTTPQEQTQKAPQYELESDSILLFNDNENSAKLIEDMEAGRIPKRCNVLYDTMGARPSVEVTDEETIKQIFELLCEIEVVGLSEWSITDCYHHVFFELQDGTIVGFRFEGEELLVGSETNYELKGGNDLWKLVRDLQDQQMEPDGTENCA